MNKDQLLIKYRTELMGIASLGVILCHAVVADVKLPNVIIKVLVYGNLGVDMFLLMSGIGMYYSLNQTKYICHWYKKRAMRLLLPYFIVMLPYWVIYSLLNRQGVLGFLHYFSTLSFWTEHIGAWYVAMLIPFYLMLPYIFCLWRKSPVLITVILTSVSIILGAYPLEDSDLHMQVFSNAQFCIKRLPAFWVGLLFGYCSECSPRFDLKSMRGGISIC